MGTDLHLREVLQGASVAVSIRLAGTLLGFAVSVTVARLLGADGAGLYFLTLSLITTTVLFCTGRLRVLWRLALPRRLLLVVPLGFSGEGLLLQRPAKGR